MKTKTQKQATKCECKARVDSNNTTAQKLPPPSVKHVFQGYHKTDDASKVPDGYAYAIYRGTDIVALFKDIDGIDSDDMFQIPDTLDALLAGEEERVLSTRLYRVQEEAEWIWDAVTRFALQLAFSPGYNGQDSRRHLIAKMHKCTSQLMRGEHSVGISESGSLDELA